MSLVKWLLDYVSTQPDAILTYKKSNMILAVHSDASYLSEANARSHSGGHFFCSECSEDPSENGAVHIVSKILWPSCPAPLKLSWVHSTSTPPQSRTHVPTPQRDGPQATENPNRNQQQHKSWSRHQQHSTLPHKGHGHAFSLAL